MTSQDTNSTHWIHRVPLLRAAEHGDLEAIKREVLENKVDVNLMEGEVTALMLASNVETMKLLIDLGADINLQTPSTKTTALLTSPTSGQYLTLYLLSKGADIYLTNVDSESVLFSAVTSNRLELTKILVETYNIDIEQKNRWGLTAFNVADQCGAMEVALYLWKVSQSRRLRSSTAIGSRRTESVKKNRSLSGKWLRPYVLGEEPRPCTTAKLSKNSKQEFFIYGGRNHEDTYACIYQLDLNIRVFSLFAICAPVWLGLATNTPAPLAAEEEIEALQALHAQQSHLVIGRLGAHVHATTPYELRHRVQGDSGTRECSTALANEPFTSNKGSFGICYYEVYIVKLEPEAAVAVGICDQDYDLDVNVPGWGENSCGFHSDLRRFYYQEGHGILYGPQLFAGDTVGCGFIFDTGQVFFTRNGEYLGVACREMSTAKPLFAAVGLTPGAIARINFGLKPFLFQFDVPTVTSTLIGDAPKVGVRTKEMIDSKLCFFTSAISFLKFDCEQKTLSTIDYKTYVPNDMISAFIGNERWLIEIKDRLSFVDGIVVQKYQDVLPFFVVNIVTLESRRVTVSLELLRSPVTMVFSVASVPAIGNNIYFFAASQAFYVDITTNLAHPITLPSDYHFSLSDTFAIINDPVSNKPLIAMYGGFYSPPENCSLWTSDKKLCDADGLQNITYVFDPETHSMSICPYLGSIVPSSRYLASMCVIDNKSFCLVGGSTGRRRTSYIEIFTFVHESTFDDKLLASFDNKELYDIKILPTRNNPKNKVIHANKIVLFSRSPCFFKPLILNDPSCDVIEVDETYELLYHLIRYMYADNLSSSLKEEDYFDFIELCERKAPEHLSNIFAMLVLTNCEEKSFMGDQLAVAFNTETFSDVELEVEGKVCYGHKAVLCARSEYFRAMCFSGLAETGKRRLVLKELEYGPFCKVIKYLYRLRVDLEEIESDIVAVLLVARRLNVEGLVTYLEDVLCQSLTKENVLELKDLAEQLLLPKLNDCCAKLL
eukprot:TRINITY_DN5083_c0_g2_i2.p1 TRINITY_DN5083_c0_g2~~TRINITY_DN5083_c0_g2_i2.p1  ORF type:complete len:1019 (-),score=177.26 TRINITY_DN5083_c0_g2_i2:64-3066(-)